MLHVLNRDSYSMMASVTLFPWTEYIYIQYFFGKLGLQILHARAKFAVQHTYMSIVQ